MPDPLSQLLASRDWLMADGATGTNLFNMGLPSDVAPDLWNIDQPDSVRRLYRDSVDAGVDLFVIRGTTVSAEHVSRTQEPLDLKQFIYELDVPVIVGGAAGYTPALHLMRTGAAGVLVGFGGGAAHTTRATLGIHAPMATALADVAAARRDYLDESGGRYVHVIADGAVGTSGDIVKAVACGADAVMLGAALARAVEAGEDDADPAPGPVVVVHLQREGGLAAVHRAGEEAQLGHVSAPGGRGRATGSQPRRW